MWVSWQMNCILKLFFWKSSQVFLVPQWGQNGRFGVCMLKCLNKNKVHAAVAVTRNGWLLVYSSAWRASSSVVGQLFLSVLSLLSFPQEMPWFCCLGPSAFWKTSKASTGCMRHILKHWGATLSLTSIGIVLSLDSRTEVFRHTSWLNTMPASKQITKARADFHRGDLFQGTTGGLFLAGVFCSVFLIGFELG